MVLPDGKVSPYHAVIVNTGESFMITDLRSVNGVYVRGRRIATTATLNDGDHIRIGDHELTFESYRTNRAVSRRVCPSPVLRPPAPTLR